ncbi:MAG TPA: peptide chain release factor 2 [Blastocatellia bacterium]|nr:peptide chain release factor 2 [Blastocatellia bacterium]
MIEELRERHADLSTRAAELRRFLDPEAKRAELAKIEEETSKPDFWGDQERAQKVLRRRSRLEGAIEKADRFSRYAEDATVLLEFAAEDESSLQELRAIIEKFEREVEEAETEMLLSGPNDARDAIVTINAGAGGTDAQDWAGILLRMYLRWAERHGLKTEVLDEQPGKEAGIKSATFTVAGEYAYGMLSAEAGVHRLVRLSPFNAGSSRETSFASVFVYPEIEEDIDIEIQDKDLRVDTYRSSGAGGQHVNVTDSAVRITHLPTNIVVTCQNQRSQHQNREVAMRVLKSRLYEIEMEKRRAETAQLEETKRDISFGSQIRNYVMHPYRLAKDVRTKHETSDVDAVLDGDIDEFINQYLRHKSAARASGAPDGVTT